MNNQNQELETINYLRSVQNELDKLKESYYASFDDDIAYELGDTAKSIEILITKIANDSGQA